MPSDIVRTAVKKPNEVPNLRLMNGQALGVQHLAERFHIFVQTTANTVYDDALWHYPHEV